MVRGKVLQLRRRIGGLVGLLQEIAKTHELAKVRLLEIGAYAGESTELFCRSVKHVTTIDPYLSGYDPQDRASRESDMAAVQQAFTRRMRPYANWILRVATSDAALPDMRPASFDVVYIDGKHTYEQTLRDITNAAPLLRAGGYMCGHDYSKSWPGVMRAVREVYRQPDKVFSDASWLVRV